MTLENCPYQPPSLRIIPSNRWVRRENHQLAPNCRWDLDSEERVGVTEACSKVCLLTIHSYKEQLGETAGEEMD